MCSSSARPARRADDLPPRRVRAQGPPARLDQELPAMNPLRLVVLLVVALAALFAGGAEAYEHLGETVGSDVLSQHWRTLPIALTARRARRGPRGRCVA